MRTRKRGYDFEESTRKNSLNPYRSSACSSTSKLSIHNKNGSFCPLLMSTAISSEKKLERQNPTGRFFASGHHSLVEDISASSSTNVRRKETKRRCSTRKRKYIKRRRIPMAQQDKGKCSLAQQVAQLEEISNQLIKDGENILWSRHRDDYLDLLDSFCDDANRRLPRSWDLVFWRKFTRLLVKQLKLDIEITEETVRSCMFYGRYLQKMHKKFENDQKLVDQYKRMAFEPSELREKLHKIFGRCKPKFPREMSGGKSSRNSTRSTRSSSSRASDANTFKPYFYSELDLHKLVNDHLKGFILDGKLTDMEFVYVSPLLSDSKGPAEHFLSLSTELKLNLINDILVHKGIRIHNP